MLLRDSGMSVFLRDIQAKSGMVGNYAMSTFAPACVMSWLYGSCSILFTTIGIYMKLIHS